MPSLLHSIIRLFCVAAILCGLVAMGCDSCRDDDGEEMDSQIVDASGKDDVVAVARLANFEMRHFDIQHWWAEAVQMGKLVGRDDVPGGIAEKPTSRFRDFVEQLFENDVRWIDWEQGVDVALWRPDRDDQWRWAFSLGTDEAGWLKGKDGWEYKGDYQLESNQGVGIKVFSHTFGDSGPYYAAFVDESTVTVSNFEAGGLYLEEALHLTGESGLEEAELYVWPRRLGIGERYRAVAEQLEQEMAQSGHDMQPVLSAINQLKWRILRSTGDDDAWPEVARLWLEIERDEETGGAQRVELKIDAPVENSALLSALGSTLEADGAQISRTLPIPHTDDVRGHLELAIDREELMRFFHMKLPRPWRYAANIRFPEEQEDFVQSFERLIDHNAGPTTMAFFGSRVPTGMTADMYVAWETDADEAVMEEAREFHGRLMRDIWKPLFRTDQFASRGKTVLDFDDQKVEAEQKTLQIGHGHGELGVCWALREGQYLSYYGVMPCQRLEEILNRSEESASFDKAFRYSGELRGLVETLYLAPGASFRNEIFSGIDVDIDLRWRSEEYLQITTVFTDLPQLAEVVEATPGLAAWWDRESMFRTEMPGDELEIGITRFQEPAMTSLWVPGFGAGFPPSLLLGIPFSHPPTMPSQYQTLFFTDPDDAHDHHHHH